MSLNIIPLGGFALNYERAQYDRAQYDRCQRQLLPTKGNVQQLAMKPASK